MAEGVATESAEHRAFVRCTPKLINAIAADPLTVTTNFVGGELIPFHILGSVQSLAKSNKEKAAEIAICIVNKVKDYPEKFEDILTLLRNCSMQDVAKSIREEYRKLKTSPPESSSPQVYPPPRAPQGYCRSRPST